MKYLFLILFSFVVLNSCQSKVDEADALRIEENHDEAVRLYQEASNEGNTYAKWRLSKAYSLGLGVERDEGKSKSLLWEAHKLGCPQASCDVALAYIRGDYKIKTDEKRAKAILDSLYLHTKDTYSRSHYATLLFIGKLYDEDKGRALKILEEVDDKENEEYLWLRALIYLKMIGDASLNKEKYCEYLEKAIKKGNINACFHLGIHYLSDSFPNEQNIEKGIAFLEKGIRNNNIKCIKKLFEIYLSEDTCLRKWHNPEKGIELLEKAADLGDADAYKMLGDIYYMGIHTTKNDEKAFEYTYKAYKNGSPDGAGNLGGFYSQGIGCKKDVNKAISLWKEASDLGSGNASNNLYIYYYDSGYIHPHKTDYILAKEYLIKSAKQGNEYANYNLSSHYFKGSKLLEKNLFQAFIYCKQAADMGNVEACEKLGYMYEKGLGCDRNPDKAKEYYDKTKPKNSLGGDK